MNHLCFFVKEEVNNTREHPEHSTAHMFHRAIKATSYPYSMITERLIVIELSIMSYSSSSQCFIIEQIYSTLRRSSIYLTAPVNGLPQIKVTAATPTLTTTPPSYANCRPSTKDWNKLHQTWVGKRASHFTRERLGGVKKLTKRRPKETLVKNWQRNLRPNCRSDRRRKRADDTLQRNRDTSVRRGPEQRRGPKPDQVRNHYQDLKK